MPRGEVRIGPGMRGCIGNKHHLCAALAKTHVPISSTRLVPLYSISLANESPCPSLPDRSTWIPRPVVRRRSTSHATVRCVPRSRSCPSSIRLALTFRHMAPQDSTSRRDHDRILRSLKPPAPARLHLPLQCHAFWSRYALSFVCRWGRRQKIHL